MLNILVSEIKDKIGIKGTDLNSRDWGVQIREEIEKEVMKYIDNDGVFCLDFSEITSFNSSIADEVIVLLTKKIIEKNSHYYIISKNIPDNSLYDLELVTAHRKIPCLIKATNKKRPVVICGEDATKMEMNQRLVYDLVMKLGRCTARKIADIMDKDIYTASTYLNKLFKLHLLRREEVIDSKGKQYVYMPVV